MPFNDWGQQAEPLGTQPEGQVEAAGEKLWEIQSAGSMPRSRVCGETGLSHVWFRSMSGSVEFLSDSIGRR